MVMKCFQGMKINPIKAITIGDETIGYIPDTELEGYIKYIDNDFEGLEILKKYIFKATELYKSEEYRGYIHDIKTKVTKDNILDNVLVGSSTFMNIAMGMYLKKKYGNNIELAIFPEIENAKKHGFDTEPDYKIGINAYDVGVVLKDLVFVNEYHARNIAEQLDPDMGLPVVMWLKDMKLELDEKAPGGISIIADPKKAFTAKVLEKDCKFNELDENGMPIPDENGERVSAVAHTGGLSRLWLLDYSSLFLSWDGLAAPSAGRMIIKIKSE
ncbi:MAG: hypothetical protein J7K26_02360 [Candidatus Aenigmarchaeota archaeon]|nr:hypothetical protein [Candidatus Aenigmarchaeota archaeon]